MPNPVLRRGEWSAECHVATNQKGDAVRSLNSDVPQAWLELRYNMHDMLQSIQKKHSRSTDQVWQELVLAWKRHVATVKLAYRMYTLLGSTEADPSDINMFQFRKFVEDCNILQHGMTKTDVDLIFTRVNRVVEPATASSGGRGSPPLPLSGRGSPPVSSRSESPDPNRMDKIVLHEFVHALVRLSLQYSNARKRDDGSSLARCFDALVDECVAPNATFPLKDEFTEVLKSREVRAVLSKHNEQLMRQYCRWSGADRTTGSSKQTMSLHELMLALKEAKILDDKCTTKEVVTFFVMVNADDELYGTTGEQNGSAELDFQEFVEVVGRMCREKVLAEKDQSAEEFAEAFDNWLGLIFLPALRNAGKGIVVETSKSTMSPRRGRRASVKMIESESSDAGPNF